MQLIYKTDSIKRADEIHDHLERAGIPVAIHGAGTYSLVRSRAADAVSVWVVRDEDVPKAQELLASLFKSEAMVAGVPYPSKSMNKNLRAVLLVAVAFIACLLALIAANGI